MPGSKATGSGCIRGLDARCGRIRRAKIVAILKNVEPNRKKGDLHLEPCPFCGQKDPVYIQYETDVGPRWKVFCLGEECGGCVDTGYSQQRHHVAEKRNRRAQG